MKVLLILFSCLVLVLASSFTNEPSNANARQRSTTLDSSFTGAKIIMIPSKYSSLSSSLDDSNDYYARKMSSSPSIQYRVSPIADPNFCERYCGCKKQPDLINLCSTPEDKKECDDSESSSNESSDEKDSVDEDELPFKMEE